MSDWKSDLTSREPDELAVPDGDDLQALIERAEQYERATTRWALVAGQCHDKAIMWRWMFFTLLALVAMTACFFASGWKL